MIIISLGTMTRPRNRNAAILWIDTGQQRCPVAFSMHTRITSVRTWPDCWCLQLSPFGHPSRNPTCTQLAEHHRTCRSSCYCLCAYYNCISHVTPAKRHTTTGWFGLKWSPLHPGPSCIMARRARIQDDSVSRLFCSADFLLCHITNSSSLQTIRPASPFSAI
jgi:hypothetical protein